MARLLVADDECGAAQRALGRSVSFARVCRESHQVCARDGPRVPGNVVDQAGDSTFCRSIERVVNE
jgi:hypothetical protein